MFVCAYVCTFILQICPFIIQISTFDRVIIYQKNQRKISSSMALIVFRLDQYSISYGQKTRKKNNKN